MSGPKQLYFIALIPGTKLCEEVRQLKLEMKRRFNAAHALKSPAHITLQMPFRRPESHEPTIFRALEQLAQKARSFTVDLDGFDCFEPRVIFLRIDGHELVIKLHDALRSLLKNEVNLDEKELTSQVHPHMTIATRDLSKEAFYKAWPEFKSRVLKRSFKADHVYLLKHNGKFWDVYRDFEFKGSLDL